MKRPSISHCIHTQAYTMNDICHKHTHNWLDSATTMTILALTWLAANNTAFSYHYDDHHQLPRRRRCFVCLSVKLKQTENSVLSRLCVDTILTFEHAPLFHLIIPALSFCSYYCFANTTDFCLSQHPVYCNLSLFIYLLVLKCKTLSVRELKRLCLINYFHVSYELEV